MQYINNFIIVVKIMPISISRVFEDNIIWEKIYNFSGFQIKISIKINFIKLLNYQLKKINK